MLITLPRRSAICQSVVEVYLTGVAPLEAVSHRFNFFNGYMVQYVLIYTAPRRTCSGYTGDRFRS